MEEAFDRLRALMVKTQLIPRGISNQRVLEAMGRAPRHLFVDPSMVDSAYDDMAMPIGMGQTISQPYMVAVMTELLELQGREKVLEIGTGSGYQAAVLSMLAGEVFTIERIAALADRAVQRFLSLSYVNIRVRVGDGTLGWAEEAPFDRIIVTAAAPFVPAPLIQQLATGGILVVPVGTLYSQQLIRITKTESGFKEDYHTPCVFVPLVGRHGWEDDK